MVHHSIWATPAEPAYDDLIAQLAQRFDSPRFPAHVTLLEDFDSSMGDFSAVPFEPFELVFDTVKVTDDPSIVLVASRSEPFEQQSAAVKAVFGGHVPEPHLSLAYFPRDVQEAKQLVEASIELPITIRFSRLELWDTKDRLAARPVRDWSLIERKGPTA